MYDARAHAPTRRVGICACVTIAADWTNKNCVRIHPRSTLSLVVVGDGMNAH